VNRREKWEALANTNLLRHVLTQASKGVHYTDAQRSPLSQESYDLTQPLVDYKNAWVRDMLDYEQEHGEVPGLEGKRQWDSAMERVEADVEAVRRRYALRAAA
jgi:hypothetical protein